MSSAANHRARSHRSHARHAGAMRGVKRYAVTRSAAAAPLLSRMRAMLRRPRESRAKKEEGGEA